MNCFNVYPILMAKCLRVTFVCRNLYVSCECFMLSVILYFCFRQIGPSYPRTENVNLQIRNQILFINVACAYRVSAFTGSLFVTVIAY